MYNIHRKCLDCVVEMEHKLRMRGEYEAYERKAVADNAESYINHLEASLMEALNTSNNQYISERGEVERWKGGLDKEKVSGELKEFFNQHRKDIKEYRNDKT
jgi:hypothetical protein